MMQSLPSVATDTSWAKQNVLQNRLRLSRIIAPTIAAIGCLYFLAFNALLLLVPDARQATLFIVDGMILLTIVLLVAATLAAQRNAANLAAGLIVGAVGLTITALEISFAVAGVLDPLAFTGLGAFLVVIVLAGVLGEWTLVIAATVLSNLFTMGILLLVGNLSTEPGEHQRIISELVLLVPQSFLQQWLAAGILIAVSRMFLSTLQRLSDTQLAVERARKVDELKDQFITNVNHELRNPIMALIGYVDLLKVTARDTTVQERETFIAKAVRAGNSVRNLLDSILDVRRVDQGAANFTPAAVCVRAVFDEAIQLIDPRDGRVKERELHIDIPDDLAIWGDPVRLQQILTNLIDNAVKYSPESTPIEVKARLISEDAAAGKSRRQHKPAFTPLIEITVRDYGLGIPPSDIPLLFQRFIRLPRDLASKVIGNGLGLYLCRILTESMDGHIWVTSTGIGGQGSIFTLQLPASQQPQ